ncbi:MAG: MMPL family transporter [Solirubrobacterales bacterium]|nr:MMPL family transporter [Solirubrobacterales bacterium]
MTPALYALGRFCTRHRFLVLLAWIIIAAGLVIGSSAAGHDTSNNLTLNGTGSQNATNLLNARWPAAANGSNPIVLAAPSGALITNSKYADAIAQTAKNYQNDPGVIQGSVVSPLGDTAQSKQLISKDGQTGIISIAIKQSPADLTAAEGDHYVKLSAPATKAGLTVGVGGYIGTAVSNPNVDLSVIVGIGASIVILLFTFGTFLAMGLPMVTALFGLAAGISAVYLLGQLVAVPTIGPTLAVMIGLGVVIDYSLFMVSRHRQQVGAGLSYHEAAARATATAGGAVVFAGSTVILALLCLAVVKVPILSAMGYSSALAVLVAMLAALTLMPALLAIAGKGLDRFALPFFSVKKAEKVSETSAWARWTGMIIRFRIPSLILSVIVLGLLTYPVHQLYLGQQDNGSFPTDTQTRIAYDLLEDGYGPGANASFLIAIAINSSDQTAVKTQLGNLTTALNAAPGVASASPASANSAGTAATIALTPKTGPSSQETSSLVTELRTTTIPAATKGTSLKAYVGGTTASYVDLATLIGDRLILTIGVVVLLGFLLMTMAFRALGLALISSIMNLVTVAAAFGVTTAVFEVGRGTSLIGLDGQIPVVSYVPLMMFAVLFGLSMDYNVFLMSVMREKWLEKGNSQKAIVEGMASTGKVVSAAALIMIAVFLAFVINGNPIVKQFGVGTAVAITIYATVVRCVLLPALMSLFGKACWYMPVWLDRIIPKLSIEGDKYFDDLAAKAAAAK